MLLRLISALLCIALIGLGLGAPAWAGVEQISEKEFRALASEISHKVNLFADTWERDPDAQFYGGTTRDYLYWLKGKFRQAHTRAEAERVIAQLRAEPRIDVREFIIGDSDVDIFSAKSFEIKPDVYGVKRIDTQSLEVLDPTTALGKNEIDQGYIPAEKIRLHREGLESGLGDGLREIYTGRLTAHFTPAEQFARSKYASEGINHPILLALRYLRLQAINYFQDHGPGRADAKKLLAQLDPATAAQVRAIIENSLASDDLKKPLDQPRFKKWVNAAIRKAFRSYTNPNAAKVLMEEFGVTQLPSIYKQIEPVNQYVFAQYRDAAAIEKNLREFDVKKNEFFLAPGSQFSDGHFYHGTRTEEAFRGILFQGVMPSETGVAGAGLYGVSVKDKAFSENWGGDPNRLLRFPVKENARVVDTTTGEGQRVWKAFSKKHGPNWEKFAESFGVDILAYPYSTRAFAVKNSEALGQAQGVYREMLPFSEILSRARGNAKLEELLNLFSVNKLTDREVEAVLGVAKISPIELETLSRKPEHHSVFLKHIFRRPPYSERADLMRPLLTGAKDRAAPELAGEIMDLFAAPPWRERDAWLIEWMKSSGTQALVEERLKLVGDLSPRVLDAAIEQPVSKENLLEALRHPQYSDSTARMEKLLVGATPERVSHAAPALVSAAWNTRHPEFVRKTQLALQTMATDRGWDLGPNWVNALADSEPGGHLNPDILSEITKRAQSDDLLLHHLNKPTLAPHREEILRAILDRKGEVPNATLLNLAAALLHAAKPEDDKHGPRIRSFLQALYNERDFITGNYLPFHRAVLGIAASEFVHARFTLPPEHLATIDKAWLRLLRSSGFYDDHRYAEYGMGRKSGQYYMQSVPLTLARWEADLATNQTAQDALLSLVKKKNIPPAFEEFANRSLARDDLPPRLRKGFAEYFLSGKAPVRWREPLAKFATTGCPALYSTLAP